ncbi:MAG: CRISPR-associated protein Csn1 [Prevotella sp.]|nr:CRISPR-associated protein Csn1 [Prevotella sp.]
MKKRILGIDTGTNSLGWAVVDKQEDGKYSLVRKGSLIFQEGVKVEKGIESSKAADRTAHRALRKQYFRRRLRKIEVLKVLIEFGWCPYLSPEALHQWHVKKEYPMDEAFISWQRTNDNYDDNPYYYRHRCLHEQLDLNERADRYVLGRAMYHLAQRRGFLSNRLEQGDDDETGKVKEGISSLSKSMAEAGCEYLGDFFYKLYKEKGNTERIRTRYTDGEEHYKKEFYAICERQNLSEEQISKLEKALYFQRPLKSQRQGVGKCTFEPKKARVADSHPAFELFRMLSFVNNIKIKGPHDVELRPLSQEEFEKAKPMFLRKSKPQFDFEDIAKAIAGKGNYQHIKDIGDKAYKFNYRMTQSVTGCPTIACFISVFGDDYENAIAERYTLSDGKTSEQMVYDVWNVLYSFDNKEKLKQWGKERLQMDDDEAEKFSKIKLNHSFASLSLAAVKKILPWLEQGLIYPHAVLMANVPDIVGEEVWKSRGEAITNELLSLITNFNPKDVTMTGTLDFCIKDILKDMCSLNPGAAEKLYHPSMIDTYPDAKKNSQGVYQLGSPRTNAVRNPMAMRSLHQLRKVINTLLREGIIDSDTEVHIEYARELNDANKRKAIAQWNKERETRRKKYTEDIRTLYKQECGKDIVPSNDDIIKFQLWEEQDHICLYTGDSIGITEFVGPNPSYDIEHTVPRSVGGDSTLENMTLCSSKFNRDVKKAKLPTQLSNHAAIMERLEEWRKKIEKLRKDVDHVKTHSGMDKAVKDRLIQKRHLLKLELEYWVGKYKRFQMEEVPEGFARRQGAGIGLVGKYAGLYLKSLFHKADDRNKSNVRVIKGATTAEYRKMWGIQDEYEKKSRDNHVHHCIDAITIACIEPGEYNATARYYQQLEEYERTKAAKPSFPKPWPTFTEDIKAIAQEMLVVHSTPDNMPKHARKYVQTSNGRKLAMGDSARGSLHNDTYYGAIERDGEIKYVVRKLLGSLKESDVENIVDDAVKEKVKQAIAEKGFKKAMEEDIFMNREKGIKIKKVRCFTPTVTNPLHIRSHRDESRKEYKRQFHVTLDGNYCMAIYEGEVKGKMKRTYEIVNMIDAAAYYKKSADLTKQYPIAPENKNGLKYRCSVRTGTQIILMQSDNEEINLADKEELARRFYFVAVMQKDGRIVLRYNQDARDATTLKKERKSGAYKVGEEYRSEIMLSLSDFHALVEGVDFKINVLGEIVMLK